MDKERDIRGIESDVRVPNSGLAQTQLMKWEDFITSDQRGSLSPFCEYWVSISGANLTLSQDGHAIGTNQRSFPIVNASSPLLIAIPCVGSGSNHINIPTCLGWYTIQCVIHEHVSM